MASAATTQSQSVLLTKPSIPDNRMRTFKPDREGTMGVAPHEGDTLGFSEIAADDEFLKPNQLCERAQWVNPGTCSKDKSRLVLSLNYYDPKQQYGLIILDGEAALNLLFDLQLCLIVKANARSHVLPAIGQRLPTPARRAAIRDRWEKREWRGKRITIETSVFNAQVSPTRGLMLSDQSRVVVWDGAGRTSTLYEELNKIMETDKADFSEHIFVRKGMILEIKFDLSGDLKRIPDHFEDHNSLGKHTTGGTNMGVQTFGLMLDDRKPHQRSFADNDWGTWVVQQIWDAYHAEPEGRSLLKFMHWQFEGKKQKGVNKHSKAVHTMKTAIDNDKMRRMIERFGFKVKDLPDAFSTIMKGFYELCPTAVRELETSDFENLNEKGQRIAPRLLSTLGLKLMFTLGIGIYRVSGGDMRVFRRLVGEAIQTHFDRYRSSAYNRPGKRKFIEPDDFWYNHIAFCTPLFNSGGVNTATILPEFTQIVEEIVDRELRKLQAPTRLVQTR